jgi:hypothetical protein
VLSFPIPLRILFAAHPDLLSPVLQCIHRVIATFLLKQAGLKRGEGAAMPVFHEVRGPTAAELETLLSRIIQRILSLLTRTGYLIAEQGMSYLAEAESDSALTPLQAAACNYRIALGPRAGQKVLSLQTVPSRQADPTQLGCVNAYGFSLHAAVRCAAHQRKELERLCRYITRPAIANERLKRNQAGQVVLQLKSPYRDGTTHIVMSPLEFMQRLAALVPPPRLHLIRFHGVLAPRATLRAAVVPSPAHYATEHAADHAHAHGSAPTRMSWARLLKRVFDIDIEYCPRCGNRLQMIAAIVDLPVIAKILAHLHLPARAPPRSPARRLDLVQAA